MAIKKKNVERGVISQKIQSTSHPARALGIQPDGLFESFSVKHGFVHLTCLTEVKLEVKANVSNLSPL